MPMCVMAADYCGRNLLDAFGCWIFTGDGIASPVFIAASLLMQQNPSKLREIDQAASSIQRPFALLSLLKIHPAKIELTTD